MRFDLQSEIKVTLSNSMLVPFVRIICTISIPLDCMIYQLAIIKSHAFGQISLIKRLQLFVKYQDTQESKYHIDFVFNIILNSVVIKLFLGGTT